MVFMFIMLFKSIESDGIPDENGLTDKCKERTFLSHICVHRFSLHTACSIYPIFHTNIA